MTNAQREDDFTSHGGHRERLRARYKSGGFSALADYEQIELLLTYLLPRVDVKPAAKALLKKFGNIRGIIDAPEDELDLSKVKFNLEKFRALTKGFVGALKGRLTPIETDTLALGVYSMTVELAVRFLTDYLNGDTYFSTNYPGHNLDRAKCQLALADSVYGKLDAMREIVREYAK